MKIQVTVTLDTSVPEQKAILDRLAEIGSPNSAMPTGAIAEPDSRQQFVRHLLTTKAGRSLILPAVKKYGPEEKFTMADLAGIVEVLAPAHKKKDKRKVVFSWIRQLGRPEKRFGMKLFQVHKNTDALDYQPVAYSFSPEMHAEILKAVRELKR